jgi:hypothetical protein
MKTWGGSVLAICDLKEEEEKWCQGRERMVVVVVG